MFARPPAIPASLAALVMLAGLGLVYWSLASFGALRRTEPASAPDSGSGAGVEAS